MNNCVLSLQWAINKIRQARPNVFFPDYKISHGTLSVDCTRSVNPENHNEFVDYYWDVGYFGVDFAIKTFLEVLWWNCLVSLVISIFYIQMF